MRVFREQDFFFIVTFMINSITECSRFLRSASLYDDYGVNIVYDGTISSGCDAAVEMLCGIVPAMRVKL